MNINKVLSNFYIPISTAVQSFYTKQNNNNNDNNNNNNNINDNNYN